MAEDDDQAIGTALALLAVEDAEAANEAQAALEWITAGEGLELVTQHRVQGFCWYELPVKWMTSQDGNARVVAALARAFDLLQMPRYAAICRSGQTREILAAYQGGMQAGMAAYRRAAAASGISPPDLPDFAWGQAMGIEEARAWLSAGEALELAIASSDLIPGKRGWKTRQQELVRAHLEAPRDDLLGQSSAGMILSERAESWTGSHRSPTWQKTTAAIANRLLHPVSLPAESAGMPLPRWQWLLGELDAGVHLTQTGNLGRAFVQQHAARFGWDFSRPPTTETDLYDLHQLRGLAGTLRLTRKAGRMLTLTVKGRDLLADPNRLWRSTAAALIGGNTFTIFTGELLLALLLGAGGSPVPAEQVADTMAQAAAEEGFRDSRTGLAPGERDIAWAIAHTANLCRALELLQPGSDWPNRAYQLTPASTATAQEALRARATGPRNL
jgi:hypothetical protein